MNATALPLFDGTQVIVPDSLDLITPYVLREQLDWFEDEIRFLRRVAQPGEQVIDIGANYGLYTLSLARAVGPGGHVWAYEPASETAGYLARSIEANALPQVTVVKAALSDHGGHAVLALHDQSEINAIVEGAPAEAGETVPLCTLDAEMTARGWRDIALVKMDAEGQEANILRGGTRFLQQLSPLVMFEVKASADVRLDLVDLFAAQGWRSYRLVPGLGLLAPFDRNGPVDSFVLNLFACKPDRAAALQARGLLVSAPQPALDLTLAPGTTLAAGHGLEQQAHGCELAALWRDDAGGRPESARLALALAMHAISRDAARPPAERLAALEGSLRVLQALCHGRPAALRVCSLARVAADAGARGLAVHALDHAVRDIAETRSIDPGEPFLAPVARFEQVAPGGRVGEWVLAALLEAQELCCHYSSFYTGTTALDRLQAIEQLGFGSDEMARRLALVRRRFGLPRPTVA